MSLDDAAHDGQAQSTASGAAGSFFGVISIGDAANFLRLMGEEGPEIRVERVIRGTYSYADGQDGGFEFTSSGRYEPKNGALAVPYSFSRSYGDVGSGGGRA